MALSDLLVMELIENYVRSCSNHPLTVNPRQNNTKNFENLVWSLWNNLKSSLPGSRDKILIHARKIYSLSVMMGVFI